MEEILKVVGEREGFNNEAVIELEDPTLGKGAQFHGKLLRGKITDGKRSLSLIVKSAPSDPRTRKVISAKEKFSNEILFYTRIYPTLCRYGSPPTVPRLLYSSQTEGEEILVLEDLGTKGYKPTCHVAGLERDVLQSALKALERLHCASARLRDKEPQVFAEFQSQLKEAFCVGAHFKGVAEKCFQNAIRVAKELVSSDVADFLSRHHIVEEMESFTRQKRKDLVLTHGDPWASNILIKYEDSGAVGDVALVDWQMVRPGPAELDTSYLVLASSRRGGETGLGSRADGRFGLWMAVVLLPFALGQADPSLCATPHRLTFPANDRADRRLAASIKAAFAANLLQESI